jgi:hypothetical protein
VKTRFVPGKSRAFALILDQGGRWVTFHPKSRFSVGFSDTIWRGGGHFNHGHHIEGWPAMVHSAKPADAIDARDIAQLELGDDLPEPPAKPQGCLAHSFERNK